MILSPRSQTRSSGPSAILREMADQDQQNASLELAATPQIEQRIYVIRERQVMVDEDLADLYGVETKRLIEQVKRNLERFPEDFMFQLRKDEAAALRSQIATSKHRTRWPSVLRSKTAIAVNIEIMRAFVELRRVANSYAAIEKRLEQIERWMGEHDEQLEQVFGALRQLIAPPPQPKRPFGFRVRENDEEPKPRSTA